MLTDMLRGSAPPLPESDPAAGGLPLPFEQQMAQAAAEMAAAKARRAGGHRGYDPAMIEGAPDAATMGMLNADAGGVAPMAAAPSMASPEPVATAGGSPAVSPPMDVPPAAAAPAPAGDVPSWFQTMKGAPINYPPAAAPPALAPAVDPAALPPTASPASASSSPAVPPTSMLGRIGDMINSRSGTLLALGAGLAGAQNLGQGLSRGFAAAIPAQQADIKQQEQNQTVAALIKRGVPQDVALSAAANPAIMSQILPQVFGSKQRQFTQIGEDMLGNKKFGFVDPVSNKVYGLDGREVTGQSGAGAVPNGPDGQPLTGEPLLAHLEKSDPTVAAGVKGLIAGNLGAQGRNLQKLGPLAELVDPSFSMATYPARMALQKSYMGGGKDFQETQALNTVSGHMGRLADAAEGLGNSEWKPINKIANFWADTFTGSPKLVKFRNDLVTTQNELAKAYHGGHVSDSAFAAFNKSINEAQTPAELKASIGELAGLLQSKIEAKESGYRTAMGKAPLPSEYKAINEEAAHSFRKINEWASGVKAPAGVQPAAPTAPHATVAAAPKPGNYQWTPDKGLVLVQ